MEQVISFETAKLAKEIGFDWKVDKGYFSNGNLSNTWTAIHIELSGQILKQTDNDTSTITVVGRAPTQSQFQKFLREKHNMHIAIMPKITPSNTTVFYSYTGAKHCFNWEDCYETFEEALEVRLKQAVTIIKEG